MKRYNHAYTIAFEVITEHDSKNVTKEELIVGLLRRVANVIENDEILDATDAPYDSFEEEDNEDGD